jgi:hypothetical protein
VTVTVYEEGVIIKFIYGRQIFSRGRGVISGGRGVKNLTPFFQKKINKFSKKNFKKNFKKKKK